MNHTGGDNNAVRQWNKVRNPACLAAWYLFLRAGLPNHHCSPDGESQLPMLTPWRYLNQNKHLRDNISLCRMPGKGESLTWRVVWLKPISGIFVELAGCLLTQNELISPRRPLSAQSVHDITLAPQKETDWWRDRPEQRASWLTPRLLPLQPGLSPLLPVAHYLNQTLDFRQESLLLAWKKYHKGHNW